MRKHIFPNSLFDSLLGRDQTTSETHVIQRVRGLFPCWVNLTNLLHLSLRLRIGKLFPFLIRYHRTVLNFAQWKLHNYDSALANWHRNK